MQEPNFGIYEYVELSHWVQWQGEVTFLGEVGQYRLLKANGTPKHTFSAH